METVYNDNLDISNNNNTEQKPKKKKGQKRKYFLYISFVLIVTAVSLYFALAPDFNGVMNAFSSANWAYIAIIIGIIVLSYLLDGLVIFIFMRLYTKKYHLYQGAAVASVGAFYSGITPSASGGQIMQVYTLKKQGADVSNAASIMVMWFILYQIALIIFDVVAIIFKANLLTEVGSFSINFESFSMDISLIPLTILGFLLNLSIIGLLFLMSYSHKFHNFIMHHGVGILAKIKIVKNPDKTRESLRIQVENFKIELRRLQSNVPVTILIVFIFLLILLCRYSIPWFAGLALDSYGYVLNSAGEIIHTTGTFNMASFWDASFMSAYHQMVSGLIPTPGLAGVSELFFAKLFGTFYNTPANMSAAAIIWRSASFYLVILCTGLISAFYKASPKEETTIPNRATFIDLQLKTYEIRKASSDTLYETSQLQIKDLQSKLVAPFHKHKPTPMYVEETEIKIESDAKHNNEVEENITLPIKEKKKDIKSKKVKPVSKPKNKKKKKEIEDEWTEYKI